MEMKEHDWFLEVISNPSFTNTDFKSEGLDASNTSIANKEVYKNNEYIKKLFTDEKGVFDEKTFDKAYNYALYSFNRLAKDTYLDDIELTYKADRDNIFVEPKFREKAEDILSIGFSLNPLEDTESLYQIGEIEEGPLSVEEIAQEQLVFDPKTGKWSDSPNDSFFSNFFNTLVLAEWEFDADINGNPTTKEEDIVYLKGSYKLNDKGKPYYEYLNGRSTVGKNVLHKSDILTDDRDSWLNKYDFFDSDGKDKSTWGVLMKNLVSIAPMLVPHTAVPYLASVYIGTGVVLNFGKLLNTIGKVFGGSEVDLLNNTDGFLESLTLSESKHSTKSMWSLAGIIDLAGMVYKQLAEQRWLFKYGPALLKGTLWDDAAQQAFKKEKIKELDELVAKKLGDATDNKDLLKFLLQSKIANPIKAQHMLDAKNEGYRKLGEELSRIYMTGLVIADSYNEAKALGLSDVEAACYTIGYAAMEYSILKTDIGLWVLPELKVTAHKNKKIILSLSTNVEKHAGDVYKKSLKTVADKVEQLGSKLARAIKQGFNAAKIENKLGTNLAKFAIANALAEGVEETSEELIADIAKTLFNGWSVLTGDESRLDAWQNMFDRYSMSFVGGLLGGGAFSITPDLKMVYKGIQSMSREDAIREIAAMHRNGDIEPLLKQLYSTNIGNKYLSFDRTKDENGELIFAQAGNGNDLDTVIKNVIHRQINIIGDIINKHNVKFSDDTLLDAAILSDVKYARLLQSTQSMRYIEEFEAGLSKLILLEGKLQGLSIPENNTLENLLNDNKDVNGKTLLQKIQEEAKLKEIATTQKEINELVKVLTAFVDGTNSSNFILNAIFELEESLSKPYLAGTLSVFAKYKTGKELSQLNEDEIKDLKIHFLNYRKGKFADNVEKARFMFDAVMDTLAPYITPEFFTLFFDKSELVQQLEHLVNMIGMKELVDADGNTKMVPINDLSEIGEDLLDTLRAIRRIIIGENTEYTQAEENYNKAVQDYELAKSNAIKLKLDVLALLESILLLEPDSEEYKKAFQLLEALSAQHANSIQIESTLKDALKAQHKEFSSTLEYILENSIKPFLDNVEGYVVSDLTKQLLAAAIDDPSILYMMKDVVQMQLKRVDELSTASSHIITSKLGLVLGKDINIPKLLKDLSDTYILAKDDITTFAISETHKEALVEALNMVQLLLSALYGFRTDANLTNIFGYSTTRNQLEKGVKLPEIDSQLIDPFIQDLLKLEDTLMYYKRLYELSSGQKLRIQERTSVNTNLILYLRHSKLSIYIPDDWEGKDAYLQAIAAATGMQELIKLKRVDLSVEETIKMEEELSAIENALHDLFNKNIEKLKDPNVLSSIFSIDNFPGFIKANSGVLTDTSTDIDDASFYWYIASIASLKPSDFYYNYKNIVQGRKIAPIRSLELATFIGLANLTNLPVFNLFTNGLKNTIETQSATTKVTPEGIMDTAIPLGSEFYPRFGDVVFIDGVPGAGKSDVVLRNILTMLGKDHPLRKRVISIHSSEQNAKRISDEYELNAIHNFDRKKFLSYASTDHLSKFNEKNDILEVLNAGDVNVTEKGLDTINSTINTHDPAPTLIIVDEISLWSLFDVLILHDYCSKNGARLIVLGDTFLTTLQSELAQGLSMSINGVETPWTGTISKNLFAHGPKLGISMRPNNSLLEANELLFRQAVMDEEYPQKPLQYKKQGKLLFGFTVIDYMSPENLDDGIINNIKKLLQDLVDTLEEGETIGYIYDSNNPDKNMIEYLLTLEEFSHIAEKVEKLQGVTSSGKEGQYYIVEIPLITGIVPLHLRKFYTGITRAKSGGIIINPGIESLTSVEATSVLPTGLAKETAELYARKRFNILDKVYESGSEIKYHTEPKKGPAKTKTSTEEPISEEEPPLEASSKLSEGKIKKAKANAARSMKCPHMLYTFATTSLETSDDLKLIYQNEGNDPKAVDYRIDGLLGIERLAGQGKIGNKRKDWVRTYYELRSDFKYSTSYEELVGRVKGTLGNIADIESIEIHIAVKSSYLDKPFKKFERFYMSKQERLQGILNPKGVETKNQKRVVGIISINGKHLIEIPMYLMNHWEAYMLAEENKDLLDIHTNFVDSGRHKDTSGHMLKGGLYTLAFSEYVKEYIENNKDTLTEKLIDKYNGFAVMLELYHYTSNGIFYLNAHEFVGSQIATGPVVINTEKHNAVEYAPYNPDWSDLSDLESKLMVISDIFVASQNAEINGYKILAGKPFVLVTDDTKIDRSDLPMYFSNLQNGTKHQPVSLIYLANPTVGPDEYFLYLADQIQDPDPDSEEAKKQDLFDKNMGTEFTDVYILNELLLLIKNDEEKLNLINCNKDVVAQFSKIIKLFNAIDSSNKTSKLKASEKRNLIHLNIYSLVPTLRNVSNEGAQTIKYFARSVLGGLHKVKTIDAPRTELYNLLLAVTTKLYPIGIFYNVSIDIDLDTNSSIFNKVRTSLGSRFAININGTDREFKVYGKLDLTIMFADYKIFETIPDDILYREGSPVPYSKGLGQYLNWAEKGPISNPEGKTKEELEIEAVIKALPSQAKKALKGIKFNNCKEVLQALIDKNFIIVMDEKDVFVSDKALFADDVRITQYLQNPDTGNYEITLSNDEAFEVALRDGKCYVQEIKNKEQNNLGLNVGPFSFDSTSINIQELNNALTMTFLRNAPRRVPKWLDIFELNGTRIVTNDNINQFIEFIQTQDIDLLKTSILRFGLTSGSANVFAKGLLQIINAYEVYLLTLVGVLNESLAEECAMLIKITKIKLT